MDSDALRRWWADRSGEYSPEYYAHYGPDETSESIRAVLAEYLDRDAAVLEVGCSAGRHLAHLQADGFEDLSGIELNEDALAVMAEEFPDLAATGTFYLDAVEAVVEDFADGQFDAVFSVETLQHVHPDAEWVFAELARVTDDVLVTVENERDGRDRDVSYVNDEFPLYHRDYERVFSDLGLVELDHGIDVELVHGDRDTLRAFQPAGG